MPDSDHQPPLTPSPTPANDLLSSILLRFDGVALLLSVLGLGAVGGAGALVVRTTGGLAGYNTLIVGLLLLAAATVVGYYVLVALARQRLHERLAVMRDSAHELGGGDLSVEVPEGADDLGALGASLNTMRSRVARLMTAQRELLSGVSHELRSPLARIVVALELIDMELPGEEDHELIVGIREEVALLERHISRLLEAQRVTRDRVVLTRKILVIDGLVDAVITRDRLRLKSLGWRLETHLNAEDAEILGDENALDRVLSTLIENTIRHAANPGAEAAYSGAFEVVPEGAARAVSEVPGAVTTSEVDHAHSGDVPPRSTEANTVPSSRADSAAADSAAATSDAAEEGGEGGVETAVKSAEGDSSPAPAKEAWSPSLRIETELDESGVLIRVMDRGPGLSQEQCTRVFEPFFRGDQSRSTATGGTGLGMYLTRNILRAHGGDVLARPRDGGGLVVELRLPQRGRKPLKETMRVQWSDVRDDDGAAPLI